MSAVLIAGPPGCGKTTLVLKTLEALSRPAGGFYTEEIRKGGRRLGFRLVTLDGREAILASVDSRSPLRVSRYGVELAALDEVGVPAISEAVQKGWLTVIDEIAKMELFSSRFREAVLQALESGTTVFGTIMLASHPFADAVKARPDVTVLHLAPDNRHEVERQVRELLGA
jgi:nucleoside-triphosphatase